MYVKIGAVVAPIILAVSLFLRSKAADDLKTYYKNMVLRVTVLTVLSLSLYLIPTETLLKVQYRNDPEMARLKTLHYADPNNEEYKQQLDAYMMKQDSLHLEKVADEK